MAVYIAMISGDQSGLFPKVSGISINMMHCPQNSYNFSHRSWYQHPLQVLGA